MQIHTDSNWSIIKSFCHIRRYGRRAGEPTGIEVWFGLGRLTVTDYMIVLALWPNFHGLRHNIDGCDLERFLWRTYTPSRLKFAVRGLIRKVKTLTK